eukprot:Skav208740  [mRNA]  locus=scaffold742:260896:276075:- [translate_table: standard]
MAFQMISSTKSSRQPSFHEDVDDSLSIQSIQPVSDFQLLANKLIHQHFAEVASLEGELEVLRSATSWRRKMQKEHSDRPAKDASRSTDRSEHSKDAPSSGGCSSDAEGQPQRSTSSYRQNFGLRRKVSQLSANKILTVFETDQKDQVEKKFETDFGKLLRANTRYATSDASEVDGVTGRPGCKQSSG